MTRQTPIPSTRDTALGLLAAPFAPVFTINRTWRTMRLLPAYGIHVLGIALASALYILLDTIRFGYSYFFQGLSYEFESLTSGDPDRMLIILASIIIIVLLFESAYLVVAWVLMPWGASPEPWRRSMNRGLIRLLQLTPFHALSLVVIINMVQWIGDMGSYSSQFYYDDNGWRRPGLSWEARNFLQALSFFIYGASQIIVTLWTMAIHHDRPHWAAHSPWPAVCEGCGYQLVGMSPGQTCPECGKPVEHSFDSRRFRDDPRSIFVKMFYATVRPYAFGQTLSLYRPTTGYRKALWAGMAMLLATPIVGMATLAAIGSIYQSEIAFGLDDFIDSYGMISLGYVAVLGYTLVGSLAFGLLGATLWGAYARLIRKRNALYPAGQCFAYQSGLFTLWVLGYYPLLAIVFIVFDRMWNYNAPTPVWVGFLPFIFPAYTLLMMAVGFTLQGRLLAGARHGNG